ncbi:hypothetical protein DFP72DRAFT_824583, partial [Ephemerocybe angulata]
MDHILRTPSLFKEFGSVNREECKIRWHTGHISDWMSQVYALQEKIMVAVSLSYGEPARGTELTTHVLRNYPGGSIRNVFSSFNTLFLRGSYNKTSFFTGKDRVIARAPLPSISLLFIYFLAYVRPLFSEFQLL